MFLVYSLLYEYEYLSLMQVEETHTRHDKHKSKAQHNDLVSRCQVKFFAVAGDFVTSFVTE